jgi:hypothetical protein
MRIPILALAILATTLQAKAQFVKGEKFLSGTLTASHTQRPDNYYTSINVSPSFTKFTSDRKAIVGKLIFGVVASRQTEPTIRQRYKNFNAGIGIARQNIFPVYNNFYFSTEYGIAAIYLWGEDVYNGGTGPVAKAQTTGYNVMLNLKPEIGYRLSSRLLLGIGFNDFLAAGFRQTTRNPVIGKTETQSSLYLNTALSNMSIGQLSVRFGLRI